MREIRTSGSVGGRAGNRSVYPTVNVATRDPGVGYPPTPGYVCDASGVGWFIRSERMARRALVTV